MKFKEQKAAKLVYCSFLFLGLGTLLPWNFFITADSYWQYKFRNVSNTSAPQSKTFLQELYPPLLASLSQITNFTFLFINALYCHKVSQRVRLVCSLVIMCTFFTITTAFTRIDSDDWQSGFFTLTMITIVIMNAAGAIFQGGLFGLASLFPEHFMSAVVAGQALGGVFASAARIVSLAIGANDVLAAFAYFLIALIVMLATFFVYVGVSNMDYFKHFVYGSSDASVKPPLTSAPTSEGGSNTLLKEQWAILKKVWPLGLSITFVFLVTLAVFPVVCIKILSTSHNKAWADIYFQPVVTFLLFNVGDYIGRQSAGWLTWPVRGSKLLYVMVLSRVVFIPGFLLCNHNPSSPVPSILAHDAWYIVIMIIFSLSNGYLSSLCMMYGPRMVSESEAERAGTTMAAMLGLGLLLGACLSFAFALV